jgi:hypothetical protein
MDPKKAVRGVRPIERAVEGPAASEAEVAQGCGLAVRSALADDGRRSLCASELKPRDCLGAIHDSLDRLGTGKLPAELTRLRAPVAKPAGRDGPGATPHPGQGGGMRRTHLRPASASVPAVPASAPAASAPALSAAAAAAASAAVPGAAVVAPGAAVVAVVAWAAAAVAWAAPRAARAQASEPAPAARALAAPPAARALRLGPPGPGRWAP